MSSVQFTGRKRMANRLTVKQFLTLVVGSLVTTSALAAWQYEEVVDAFTDERAFILTVTSSVEVRTTIGDLASPVLQLRCDGEGTAPYWSIHWHNLLRGRVGDKSDLQLRFDEGRVYGSSSLVAGWLLDEPTEVEQTVTTAALNAVLRRALEAQVLRARITAYDGRTLDTEFDLGGLEEGLAKLRPHCRRI